MNAITNAGPAPTRARLGAFLRVCGVVVNAWCLGSFALVWLTLKRANIRATDYSAFHTGWTILTKGNADSLYDLKVQSAVQSALINGKFHNGVLPFNYPPYVATLFGGFARMPLLTGYRVWGIVNIALIGVLLHLIGRSVPRLAAQRRHWWRYVLFLLSTAPLWGTVIGGTFSLWVAVGIAGCIAHLREGRQFSAGLWLGLVAFKPQYLPFVLAFLLARKAWKSVAGAAVAGAALFIVSTPFVGFGAWPAFVEMLRKFSAEGAAHNAHGELMWSVRGVLTRLIERGGLSAPNDLGWYTERHPSVIVALTVTLFAVGLLTIGALRKADLGAHAAMTLATIAVVSPHGHSHDTVMMVIAAALVIEQRLARGDEPSWVFGRFAHLVYASSIALCAAYFGFRHAVVLLAPISYLTIGVLAFRARGVVTDLPAHRTADRRLDSVNGRDRASLPTTAPAG